MYMARNLPSSDENGQLDAYVKCRFMGAKKKTSIAPSSSEPCFFETLEFNENLPTDFKLAAELIVQVWDKDLVGANTQVSFVLLSLSFEVKTSIRLLASA